MQALGEVVRGGAADSTLRQLILHRMLGLPEPRYAHVPLVLGPGGERRGGITFAERLDAGETPEGMLDCVTYTLRLAESRECYGGGPDPNPTLRPEG